MSAVQINKYDAKINTLSWAQQECSQRGSGMFSFLVFVHYNKTLNGFNLSSLVRGKATGCGQVPQLHLSSHV